MQAAHSYLSIPIPPPHTHTRFLVPEQGQPAAGERVPVVLQYINDDAQQPAPYIALGVLAVQAIQGNLWGGGE